MLCEKVLSFEIAEKSPKGFKACWWMRKRQQRERKGIGRTWDPSKSIFDWRFQSIWRNKSFGYFWRVFFPRKLEVNQTSSFSHFYRWELPTKNIHEKEQMNKCKQKISKPTKLLKQQFNMLHIWKIYMHLKPDEISQWLSYVNHKVALTSRKVTKAWMNVVSFLCMKETRPTET